MNLRELLKGLSALPASTVSGETEVVAVTSDSREVRKGVVFVAVKGTLQDGNRFIGQARQSGAALIVSDHPGSGSDLLVPDARIALAELASAFRGHPSRGMKLIGVTGTSGKTTTSFVIEAILKAANLHTGLIGTVVFRHGDQVIPSTHTTPGPVELQALLAQMRDAGCQAVVMEVSSHALKQHRVGGIAFDGMVFTNLSPEHLDFHPDMEDYFLSKAMLFDELARSSVLAGKHPFAAINIDDAYGDRLLCEVEDRRIAGFQSSGFGFKDSATFRGDQLRIGIDGISGRVGDVGFHSSLIGGFNASNLMGAIAVARGIGIAPEAVARGIEDIGVVPGRLEAVPNSRGIHILVDYAHKPDALEKVLSMLKAVKGSGRLITVFGCGGDRDRQKRPVMGQIAVKHSDQVVITTDNPRTEDPLAIIAEIEGGTAGHTNFSIEADRRRAIHAAVRSARAGDIVLIAGKGHENYQIVGSEKFPFDDREVAVQALISN